MKFVLAVVMLLCSTGNVRGQAPIDDNEKANEQAARQQVGSWYRPAPHNVGGRSGSSRRLQFVEVADAFEPQSEELLRTYSALFISPSQAKQMSGGKYRATKGRPFLVRAVYLNKKTGRFSVSLQGRNLFVFHFCLSDAPLTMKRQVLIVNLDHAPRNVYRSCTVAA